MLSQEKEYFVAPADGNLVFAIKARKTGSKTPIILYAGGEHALFYRNENETIIFDYLAPKVQKMLLNGALAAIAEIDPQTEKMVCQYPVDVKIADQLPAFELKA